MNEEYRKWIDEWARAHLGPTFKDFVELDPDDGGQARYEMERRRAPPFTSEQYINQLSVELSRIKEFLKAMGVKDEQK